MIKNKKIQAIKDFNAKLTNQMLKANPSFKLPVDFKTQFAAISDDTIAEKAYYGILYDGSEETFEIDEDFEDGIKITRDKIEFYRFGEPNGLFLELIEDNHTRIKIGFYLSGRQIFGEMYYEWDCLGKKEYNFRNSLANHNESFISKIKFKNLLVKNFDLFKDFIKNSNEYLDFVMENL